MMCPLCPHCRAVVPVLVLPFLLGCTEETSVNGTVTYAGKPVPEGFITFYPVDRHLAE